MSSEDPFTKDHPEHATLTISTSTSTLRVNAHGIITLRKEERKDEQERQSLACIETKRARGKLARCCAPLACDSDVQYGDTEDKPELLISNEMPSTRVASPRFRVVAVSQIDKCPSGRDAQPS